MNKYKLIKNNFCKDCKKSNVKKNTCNNTKCIFFDNRLIAKQLL